MIRTPSRSLLAILFCLSLFAPARTQAQAVYGSISGIVTDASGALVPGASVTITSVARQTSDTVITNDQGFYTKERLMPGVYEVKAELQGFKSAVFPDIRVSVDSNTPLNIKLELGRVTEAVTVENFSPLLK